MVKTSAFDAYAYRASCLRFGVFAFVRNFNRILFKQIVVSAGLVGAVSLCDTFAAEDQGFAFLQVIGVVPCLKDFGLRMGIKKKNKE